MGKAAPTPEQTEGPFYPDLNNDLTFVASRDARAQGDFLYVHGVVQDTEGKPIGNALVDIWQTDNQGIYDHAGDPNQKKKDQDFQSYGRFVTDADGRYFFKTIKPRKYGDERFMRTPHIHYKVARRGYHELTTQLYFSDETEMNAKDGIYSRLSEEERKQVTVAFVSVLEAKPPLQGELMERFQEKESFPKDIRVGEFSLVMRAVS